MSVRRLVLFAAPRRRRSPAAARPSRAGRRHDADPGDGRRDGCPSRRRPRSATRRPASRSSSPPGCGACHTFTPAAADRERRPEPRQLAEDLCAEGGPGAARGVHDERDRRARRRLRPAGLPDERHAARRSRTSLSQAAARRPRRLPGQGPLRLPADFPARRRGRRDRPRPDADLRTTTCSGRGRSRRSRGPARPGCT